MADVPKPRDTQVLLNVYDLESDQIEITKWNTITLPFGFGAFHTGLQVFGWEICYGEGRGIAFCPPRTIAGATYRKSIRLGEMPLSVAEFSELLDSMRPSYKGNEYNILYHNCNHFTNELSKRLLGRPIPAYINKLAKFGQFCTLFMPLSKLKFLNVDEGSYVPRIGGGAGDEQARDALARSKSFEEVAARRMAYERILSQSPATVRRQLEEKRIHLANLHNDLEELKKIDDLSLSEVLRAPPRQMLAERSLTDPGETDDVQITFEEFIAGDMLTGKEEKITIEEFLATEAPRRKFSAPPKLSLSLPLQNLPAESSDAVERVKGRERRKKELRKEKAHGRDEPDAYAVEASQVPLSARTESSQAHLSSPAPDAQPNENLVSLLEFLRDRPTPRRRPDFERLPQLQRRLGSRTTRAPSLPPERVAPTVHSEPELPRLPPADEEVSLVDFLRTSEPTKAKEKPLTLLEFLRTNEPDEKVVMKKRVRVKSERRKSDENPMRLSFLEFYEQQKSSEHSDTSEAVDIEEELRSYPFASDEDSLDADSSSEEPPPAMPRTPAGSARVRRGTEERISLLQFLLETSRANSSEDQPSDSSLEISLRQFLLDSATESPSEHEPLMRILHTEREPARKADVEVALDFLLTPSRRPGHSRRSLHVPDSPPEPMEDAGEKKGKGKRHRHRHEGKRRHSGRSFEGRNGKRRPEHD